LRTTINSLKRRKSDNQRFDIDIVPLKLLEMDVCRKHGWITTDSSFGDPLYLNVNGSHLAIRVETAQEIEVDNKITL
jgi:ferrous iron transport protein A